MDREDDDEKLGVQKNGKKTREKIPLEIRGSEDSMTERASAVNGCVLLLAA